MPRTAYALTWSASSQTYTLSRQQSGENLSLELDSLAWFAWLAGITSFTFHGQAGPYTARQEVVQRGTRYWYAYLRINRRLHKKYLGKTADLTLAHLEQVAHLLHAERTSGGPSGIPLSASHAPVTVAEDPSPAQIAIHSDPLIPLLSTKFHVPRLPAQLVHRSHLTERLQQGLSQTLILLCAPAGFGKSTLLAEFLAECPMPTAWLSLDPQDNDPLRFLSALLAAFETSDLAAGTSVRTLLTVPHDLTELSLSAMFALLINDLASHDTDEFLLVLDDYHVITSEPIQHFMASLVNRCPPHLHLVISTRVDPPLSLPRVRAQGQLCELRASDLQFDVTETGRFLQAMLGRALEASTISTITSRTEGWIAGIQLTALSLHGRRTEAEVQQLLTDPAGSHRYLVDYLVEEVLADQPEVVQSFLLHTSLLDHFSASLCAAVTGVSVGDSDAMLASLERANLFLIPLDEGRIWYRYHQLWRAVLRVLLVRQLGTSGVKALYGRASRWYEQHDLPAEAIEAAIQSGEFERAVELIEQLSQVLILRFQHYTLRHWIERLPTDQWMARPLVCLAYAWVLFLSGAYDAYATPLQEAARLFRHEGNQIGVGMVDALRALVALLEGNDQQAIKCGNEALELLPPGNEVLRSVSMMAVGGGYLLAGEITPARQTLTETQAVHERVGRVGGQMGIILMLGQVLTVQGYLHEAKDHYQRVIDGATQLRSYAVEAEIRLGMLWYEWNDLDVAEAHLARALQDASQTADDALLARGMLSIAVLMQARIRQARGEQDAASVLFTQAVGLAHQYQHVRLLTQVQAYQVRYWLAQGQMEAVTRWREGYVDTRNTVPTYENEPCALTLARVLIAQGEPAEALHLLDGFRAQARIQGRLSSELEILVLCSMAESAQGKMGQAAHTLQQALALAEPEGYVRLFVDEGPLMLPVLYQQLSRVKGTRRAKYIQRLLALLEAVDAPKQVSFPSASGHLLPSGKALSGRERTVLGLLAMGRSPSEMAVELVVSHNTIKTQLSSLYRKLHAHSREEAIAEAFRLHLL